MQTALLLVVEDDPNQQILYSDELADEGYRVILAANGPEAIDKARATEPDVVVLDVVMPGMDGMEVLRALLADNDR